MENLTSVSGVTVSNNDALTSLNGLDNLTSISGGMSVDDNAALTSLNGLENLTSINYDLSVEGNAALTSLSGLNNLTSVGGELSLEGNAALTSLSGLDNLTSVGVNLSVKDNDALTSLSGLENLTSIDNDLSVEGNAALTSLSGLDNIDPVTINELIIYNNPQLFICDVQSVCEYLESGGPATISFNAPGCNTRAQVEAACIESGVFDLSKTGSLLETFPNPAIDFLNFKLPETSTGLLDVQIFNAQGKLLRRQTLAAEQPVNLKSLQAGIYTFNVAAGDRSYAGKFVKQ